MPRPSVLRLDDVHVTVRAGVPGCTVAVRVLRGTRLSLAPGEVAVLVGGAAAGKSTLLQCAAGLRRPEAGTVRRAADGVVLVDVEPSAMTPRAARRLARRLRRAVRAGGGALVAARPADAIVLLAHLPGAARLRLADGAVGYEEGSATAARVAEPRVAASVDPPSRDS